MDRCFCFESKESHRMRQERRINIPAKIHESLRCWAMGKTFKL